jgi:hypothetical protein
MVKGNIAMSRIKTFVMEFAEISLDLPSNFCNGLRPAASGSYNVSDQRGFEVFPTLVLSPDMILQPKRDRINPLAKNSRRWNISVSFQNQYSARHEYLNKDLEDQVYQRI